ncbi:uncharacterized protein LOC125679921 isoform X1 [Ostrea edulis]|uniref:uncharacterized protein LOC125679921 isoform X1 n=1 Tax=Ostrea edulis TaxID=37623 RepID=UPI0024AF5531|nr:uncharacterized protein LOC125679921 isoform X1 [Ostrea edulis]
MNKHCIYHCLKPRYAIIFQLYRLQCKESRKYQSICFHRPKILKKQTKAPMLVEHYMKRIPPYVQMVNEENIKHGLNGKFQVKSLNSDNVYEVDLYAHYPCCSCPDWQKHHLPCKHMLPIFHHFPAWDWDFLPSDYRDAPRFNLDFELLNQLQEMLPTQPQFPAELATQPEQSTKILGKKRQISKEPEVSLLTNDWQTCRELIKVIQSRVMNSCGQDLSNIVEQLQQVADELKEIEPKDDDLPVIQPLKRKRVSDPNKYGKRKKTVSSLPKQRSKRKLRKNQDKGTKMSATQDTSPDSKTWEKQFNYLMDSERRFKKACEKIVHLNKRMRNLQLRYKKAWVENHRSFRYSIRLRISVVEGLLNMYHDYALIKANIIKDLRHEMFGEDVQIITSDTSDSEDED